MHEVTLLSLLTHRSLTPWPARRHAAALGVVWALAACGATHPASPSAAATAEAGRATTPAATSDEGAFSAAVRRLREAESTLGPATRPAASAARARPDARPALVSTRTTRERPRSLAAQIRSSRVPGLVIESEESLRAVVDAVADATGLPLDVSAGAEAAAFGAGAVFDLNLTSPLAARHVLNLVADQAGEEVVWVERHGVALFVTAEKAAGEKLVRLHDIRRLTFPRTDFTAPRIDRIRLLDELEDDDGGSPFSGPIESLSQFTPDEVLESVVEFVAPTTWEDPGVSIDVIEGGLVVVHTAEVQREVARYLRQLGDG